MGQTSNPYRDRIPLIRSLSYLSTLLVLSGEIASSELTRIQSNQVASDLFSFLQACDSPLAGGAFLVGSCVWSVYWELASWSY